jgi:hypothetical protein
MWRTVLALPLLMAACAAATNEPSATSSSIASPPAASGSLQPTVQPMPVSGDLFRGTYAPLFEPTMTFTVGDAVNLDCAPNYECRGEVNADLASWVGLDFGHDHGSELNIMRIDGLNDGSAPPADLAAWIVALPGVTVVDEPTPTTIGGVAASRLDFETGAEGVGIGPLVGVTDVGAGVPPNRRNLAYTLKMDGQTILILVGFDGDNIVHDFDETVDAIQPIVDSITWP